MASSSLGVTLRAAMSVVSLRRSLSNFAASSSSSSFPSCAHFPSRHSSNAMKRMPPNKGFFRETASDNDTLPTDVFAENDKGEPIYFGRKNKSQLKRDANRYKNLASQLLSINPKTLKKLPGFTNNDRLLQDVLDCQKTTSHIAKKRAEQLVAKQLRGLEEEELKPLEEVVERVKLGVDGGLAPVDPRADDLAKEWRRRMTMVAKTEDQEEEVAITKKETLEEVFEVMQRVESEMNAVSFTRQELVDVARKAETETKETTKASEKFTDQRKRQAMGEFVFMDDIDEELEKIFLLKKNKGNTASGSKAKKKKKTAMKRLLKMLRDVAECVV